MLVVQKPIHLRQLHDTFKMIVTGIFLIVLGTRIGRISAVKADVKYEPSKISIREEIDQSVVMLPEPGPPSFVHQGSNYFFGAPFLGLPGVLPPPGRVDVIEEEIIMPKPLIGIEKPLNPVITLEEKEIIRFPKLPLPLPDVSLSVPPGAILSSLPIPFINSQLIPQVPLTPFNIPGLPIVANPPYLSRLVGKPVRLSNELVLSEVFVKEIPPPPQLPPLRLEEVFKPFVVEERKIILVPPPPKIETVLPPSIYLNEPCPPSLCARNIVFERVLPNIACENSQKVELISIPASVRQPVVTTSFLPYIIH